jgi:autotransporter-associated beta strand protein
MNGIMRLQQLGLAGLVAALLGVQSAGAAATTNTWKEGGVDWVWTTLGNWTLGHTPTATEQVRFPNLGAQYTIRTNILNTTETVDSVLADTTDRSYDWRGSGTLIVSNDFWIKGWTMHNNYIEPTLNLTGAFIISYSGDERGSVKFGTAAGYTSGNVFNGGVYNYGKQLYLGGTTTFGGTLLVQSTRLLGFAYSANSRLGITAIDGSSSVFGAGTTFDLQPGGTLWLPAANNFSNVGTLSFNGGMLRLDAASGYVFPTYANGFDVKRGMLGIAGNGTLGATDANGIRLGSTGTRGCLMGAAANTAGNYITRAVTLNGNGGVVWVSAYYNNNDMNFATPITGPGMLIKTGEKALHLRNAGSGTANSYAGGTVVASGELWLEPARTLGSGNVAIAPGGVLYLTNAAQVGAGATVFTGGNLYNPGILRLRSNQEFPTIDTNSTGTIALEAGNANAIASIGSAFLGSAANTATYSASSLPAGSGNTYRIGGVVDPLCTGISTGHRLILDVNNGDNGSGVLTGPNNLLVAYGGVILKDINTFTGTTTVRNNLKFDSWENATFRNDFQTGGSPLGSPAADVNLYNGIIQFYSPTNGMPIAKDDLNIQGRCQLLVDCSTSSSPTSTVTFATLNRLNRSQLSIYGGQDKLGTREQVYVTAAPTPVNGMVAPWLICDFAATPAFLTYGATGFARAVFSASVPTVAFPTDGTSVVQVTSTTTLGFNPDVYALRAGSQINRGAGTTVTLRSGGLIFSFATTHNPDFTFGAAGDVEGLIYANNNVTLSGILTTTAGLTKSGPGIMTLSGVNSNTLRGDITVNGGALKVTSDANLCSPTNRIRINGGALDISNQSITRLLSIGPAGGYLYNGRFFGVISDEIPGTPGGPLVVPSAHMAWFETNNTFTCPLILVGGARVDFGGTPGKGPVIIKAGSVLTLHGYGGIDTPGRYTLQSGNGYTALRFDNDNAMPATARLYRIGSVEGSGNISFGAGYQNPPANSAMIVGNDNTSCDYYGSINQWSPGAVGYTVVKEGTGTWTLWGDSLWLGPLIVSNGTLAVNGSIDRVYSVAVRTGATLSGRGYIGSPVTVDAGGTLSGSLVFATNVTLNASVTTSVTLGGTNAVSQFSQMTLNGGTLNLNGCALSVTLASAPAPGQTYKILDNVGGTITGTPFAQGAIVNATFNGRAYSFWVSYASDGIRLTLIPSGTLINLR